MHLPNWLPILLTCLLTGTFSPGMSAPWGQGFLIPLHTTSFSARRTVAHKRHSIISSLIQLLTFWKVSVHWILNISGVSAQNIYHSNVVWEKGNISQSGPALQAHIQTDLMCWGYKPQTEGLPVRCDVQQYAEERPWETAQHQFILYQGQCHGGQTITVFLYECGLQWWDRVRLHNTFWMGTKTYSSDPRKQWHGVRHFPRPLRLCAILYPL